MGITTAASSDYLHLHTHLANPHGRLTGHDKAPQRLLGAEQQTTELRLRATAPHPCPHAESPPREHHLILQRPHLPTASPGTPAATQPPPGIYREAHVFLPLLLLELGIHRNAPHDAQAHKHKHEHMPCLLYTLTPTHTCRMTTGKEKKPTPTVPFRTWTVSPAFALCTLRSAVGQHRHRRDPSRHGRVFCNSDVTAEELSLMGHGSCPKPTFVIPVHLVGGGMTGRHGDQLIDRGTA